MHAQWGRKVVSVMQRLHGHVRLSFPRYMHINLRPPAVQDQLRSIYYESWIRSSEERRFHAWAEQIHLSSRQNAGTRYCGVNVRLDCFSGGTLFAGFESLNRATRGDKSREIGNPFCPLDRVGCVKISVVDREIC